MLTKTREISNSDDIIDVRDIIARIEDLEIDLESAEQGENSIDVDIVEERNLLCKFMNELKGKGGNHQWRGGWYPVTIIRDSYFEEYAQELAEDCCLFLSNSHEMKALGGWPYRYIDWKQAARELQMDYTSVTFDDVTYWVR